MAGAKSFQAERQAVAAASPTMVAAPRRPGPPLPLPSKQLSDPRMAKSRAAQVKFTPIVATTKARLPRKTQVQTFSVQGGSEAELVQLAGKSDYRWRYFPECELVEISDDVGKLVYVRFAELDAFVTHVRVAPLGKLSKQPALSQTDQDILNALEW